MYRRGWRFGCSCIDGAMFMDYWYKLRDGRAWCASKIVYEPIEDEL